MAILGRWTGGVVAERPPNIFWNAPTGIFTTEERNDNSSYSFDYGTSTLTLPSTGLADGYMIIAAFETQQTVANNYVANSKIVQTAGTGTFVGNPSGGYSRDLFDDTAYVRCWAFVDSPSASSTFQLQWRRDTAGPPGQNVRAVFEVIPLYYTDFASYTSASTQLGGTTTPEQITGFSGTDGQNISLSSNVVTLSGRNKRYIVLSGAYNADRDSSGRTQRWHGIRINGVQENAAKSYFYNRSAGTDSNGNLSSWIVDTGASDVSVDQYMYLGDGTAAGEGGADITAGSPSEASYALVLLELADKAEVFRSKSVADQSVPNAATPVALDIATVAGIELADAGSFTRSSDTAFNAEASMDMLFGCNVSGASEDITSNQRFTMFAEMTLNGANVGSTFSGNYLRGNVPPQRTFGISANSIGFAGVSLNDDIGLSAQRLSTSGGGGGSTPDVQTQSGWVGAWGVNIDTMQSLEVSGVVAASETNSPQASGSANVFPPSATASSEVSSVTSGTQPITNWSETSPSQSAGGTQVAPAQVSGFTKIIP